MHGLTLLFSAVKASVNQSFSYYDLKEELHDAIKHLQKSQAPEATLEFMKMTEKYNNIMTKLVKLGVEKIKHGNISYPKIINTAVLNNTYRIHYKYVSSDITRQELGRIQEDTYPLLDSVLGGDFPDLDLAVRCHDARTFLRTIHMYSTSRAWPTCATNTKTHKCQQQNESHTLDIVLMLLPEDRSESLEILAFCGEIVGSKAIWSTDSTTRSMFIGMLESLSYMPVLYGLEIKHEIMKIYTMKRNFKYDQVDVESKEFSLAGSPQKMRQTLYCLIDDLSKMFLTIALELTPCAFAVAKYLQHAGYMDSKLLNHGRCVLLHKDCWHLHASSFEQYTLDIESKREEYEGFGGNGDDNDNNQGDGNRQKSLPSNWPCSP